MSCLWTQYIHIEKKKEKIEGKMVGKHTNTNTYKSNANVMYIDRSMHRSTQLADCCPWAWQLMWVIFWQEYHRLTRLFTFVWLKKGYYVRSDLSVILHLHIDVLLRKFCRMFGGISLKFYFVEFRKDLMSPGLRKSFLGNKEDEI